MVILGDQATPAGIAAIHAMRGLDKPIWAHYGDAQQ
jgi:hypothetical protein